MGTVQQVDTQPVGFSQIIGLEFLGDNLGQFACLDGLLLPCSHLSFFRRVGVRSGVEQHQPLDPFRCKASNLEGYDPAHGQPNCNESKRRPLKRPLGHADDAIITREIGVDHVAGQLQPLPEILVAHVPGKAKKGAHTRPRWAESPWSNSPPNKRRSGGMSGWSMRSKSICTAASVIRRTGCRTVVTR